MTRLTGVLGGTFDPVHRGHLAIAGAALRRIPLQQVLLLPCAVPPHKSPALSPALDRLAMLRLAIEGLAGFGICTLELELGGARFTLDTLRLLSGRMPGERLAFVVGTDSLHELPSWHDHLALLEEFDLVAVDRPGFELDPNCAKLAPEIRERLVTVVDKPTDGSPRIADEPRVFYVPMPPLAISSHEIRAHVRQGREFDSLVPPPVARYIQTHRLYRQEDRP